MAARAFGSAMGQIPGFGAAIEACGRLETAAAQSELPDDPVSGPQEAAIRAGALLEAFLDQGFDRSEAFCMVHLWVQSALMHAVHG